MLIWTLDIRRAIAPLVTLPLLILGCRPTVDVDRMPPHTDLLRVLRAEGEVPVVVALTEPAGYGDQDADMDRIRTEIARMQAEVLASLDSTDYRNRSLFASVPAMAGVVLSERGLQRLLASPHVERVDVDPGGTGAR